MVAARRKRLAHNGLRRSPPVHYMLKPRGGRFERLACSGPRAEQSPRPVGGLKTLIRPQIHAVSAYSTRFYRKWPRDLSPPNPQAGGLADSNPSSARGPQGASASLAVAGLTFMAQASPR